MRSRERSDAAVGLLGLAVLAGLFVPTPTAAQDACRILCAPELNFEPTFSLENLLARPRVAVLEAGQAGDTVRTDREWVFEAIVAVGVPTEIPRLELTLEAIWPPFEDGNELELEAELNLMLLTGEETSGWVGAHFDVVDQFSPAGRPGRRRAYTHKLDFELDVAVTPFRWLPEGRWLRNLEIEGSLDYLATGLPRRGDRIGERLFLDDASGWSFSTLLVIPVAPLAR